MEKKRSMLERLVLRIDAVFSSVPLGILYCPLLEVRLYRLPVFIHDKLIV